jgi:uncharacterized phiE125 gp8 family phage protein
MTHGISRLVAPTEEPVTLAEAKLHLRVEHDAEDMLITSLIVTARQAAESRTGRALISQQWRLTRSHFEDCIDLPYPPLITIDAITYLDSDGTRQTLASSEYQAIIDTLIGRVQPAYGLSWPVVREMPGSIRVDFTAGYGTSASSVPQAIKSWMLMAIATWYAQREASTEKTLTELPRGFWHGLLDEYTITQV